MITILKYNASCSLKKCFNALKNEIEQNPTVIYSTSLLQNYLEKFWFRYKRLEQNIINEKKLYLNPSNVLVISFYN